MLNVQEVPDNQWPPKMKLMKEAAEKSCFGERFRKMTLETPLVDQPPPFGGGCA